MRRSRSIQWSAHRGTVARKSSSTLESCSDRTRGRVCLSPCPLGVAFCSLRARSLRDERGSAFELKAFLMTVRWRLHASQQIFILWTVRLHFRRVVKGCSSSRRFSRILIYACRARPEGRCSSAATLPSCPIGLAVSSRMARRGTIGSSSRSLNQKRGAGRRPHDPRQEAARCNDTLDSTPWCGGFRPPPSPANDCSQNAP